MNKKIKISLIISLCFVFTGAILFVIAMSINNWDFKKLGSQNFETNSYEFTQEFNNLLINTSTADIDFQYSNDEKCKIICYENKKEKHSTTIENGILSINCINEKKWYDYISLFSNNPKITVYLPKLESLNLEIKLSTGDINITDFTFENISISASTGDVKCSASSKKQTKIHLSTGDIFIENSMAENYDLVSSTGLIKLNNVVCSNEIKLKVTTGDNYLTNVNCKNIVSTGSTGDINLNSVIATNNISITRNTGDVEFYKCDASEIVIKTSTGDVEGTLLSDKVFITKSNTGDIEIPKTTTGGKCKITTNTGDIEISIINNTN
ncbi:MAG: DUF4097 family beta strand repeat protein [Clostridia bacterium]|nr:DUF4097 family beta strand repeat protein [Clostridia bacterium]